MSGLVNCLHCHAASQRGIANQSDDVVILALTIACNGHAQCRGKGGRSMARAKRVVFRFITPQKTTNAAVLFDRRQQIATSRENLMRVGLMAYVPNQAVVRRIERVMKRDCQFNGAERSSRMPTHTGHRFQNILPDLVGDLR